MGPSSLPQPHMRKQALRGRGSAGGQWRAGLGPEQLPPAPAQPAHSSWPDQGDPALPWPGRGPQRDIHIARCAGQWGLDRPAVAPWSLGTLSPARGLWLKRRLCSASPEGSVEPPWAQVSPSSRPWERRSELRTRPGPLRRAHPALREADPGSGGDTSRAALPVPPAPGGLQPAGAASGGGELQLAPAPPGLPPWLLPWRPPCPQRSPLPGGQGLPPGAPKAAGQRGPGQRQRGGTAAVRQGAPVGQGCCGDAGLSPSPAQAPGPRTPWLYPKRPSQDPGQARGAGAK